MDKTKSSAFAHTTTDPNTRAGAPFAHAGGERPHACIGGVVYIGHMTEDPETGEEVEVFEAVRCRRC